MVRPLRTQSRSRSPSWLNNSVRLPVAAAIRYISIDAARIPSGKKAESRPSPRCIGKDGRLSAFLPEGIRAASMQRVARLLAALEKTYPDAHCELNYSRDGR